MMKTRFLLSVLGALIASAGLAFAQDKDMSKQPPAKQSAPAESSHGSGHDAQTGKPETAEKPKGQTTADKRGKKNSTEKQ
jgi:hypothetical protein